MDMRAESTCEGNATCPDACCRVNMFWPTGCRFGFALAGRLNRPVTSSPFHFIETVKVPGADIAFFAVAGSGRRSVAVLRGHATELLENRIRDICALLLSRQSECRCRQMVYDAA